METIFQDLKHSLRMFRQNPAFTFAAVAALALGIGANTAIFSVVNTVLLSPLDVYEPDRLITFRTNTPTSQNALSSPAKFAYWKGMTDVIELISASRTGVMNYTGGDEPEQVTFSRVSKDYFQLYGAQVMLGRTFTADEDAPKGPLSVVVSYSFWERRFNSDPDILGRTLLLGGVPHVAVGVMDPGFDISSFGPRADVWVPFQLDPASPDQGHYFGVGGRLRPGVTLEQANARVAASADGYRELYPDFGQGGSFDIQPLQEALVANARSSLLALSGAVGLVLLIACANVANLLLARAAGRRREIAIRAAIGAGRGRIIRQLLTESVLLSMIAGAIGLGLGALGIRGLLSVNTAGLPLIGDGGALVTIDWRVVAFTVAAASITGILFGLIPALQSSKTDLNGALKEGGGRSGSGFRQNKARSALIVMEVSLALVLLIGSVLLIRTSVALADVDPGFNVDNVVTMRMSLADERFSKSEAVENLVQNGVRRIEALPGVEVASATCCVPLQGGYGLPFVIAGRPLGDQPVHGGGGWATVSPGFFEVFRIPAVRGRTFTLRDISTGPPVVIINETMAREYWPDGDPIGERLIIGRTIMREFADEPERQIVGVVGDVRDAGLNNDPQTRMYVPQAQLSDAANALNLGLSPIAWVVRTQGSPAALTERIQTELRQASGLPLASVTPMEEVVSNSLSRQKFNMWLMTVFGFTALLLAAIGIYGLMAYSVQQRTQEIGIRLALGARLDQVRNMLVAQGMVLAGVGVAIGLAAAYGLAQFISTFLFGVEAHDPLTFVAVPLLLGFVALAAIWIPARRASRVEPLKALRYE
jgi:predicted permease